MFGASRELHPALTQLDGSGNFVLLLARVSSYTILMLCMEGSINWLKKYHTCLLTLSIFSG